MITPAAPAAQAHDSMRGLGGFLNRSEAWLDSKGRGAWIVAMVLSFIVFWPIGLALVFYMTFTNRWSKTMFGQSCRSHRSHSHRQSDDWGQHWGHRGNFRSSGNSAFDAYKAETLRRLEEEQTAFEAFLERLRAAKDKTEFDKFMDDRSRSAQAVVIDPEMPTPPTGGGSAPGPVPQSY